MKYAISKKATISIAAVLMMTAPSAVYANGIKDALKSAGNVVREAMTSKTPKHVSPENQKILDELKRSADDINSPNGGKGGAGSKPTAHAGDDLKMELFDKDTILQKYGRNLSDMAKLGKFDHIKANPQVVREMIIRLMNPDTPSITLTAEAGVGKTAAVQAFAKTLLGKTEKELKAEFELIFKEHGDTLREIAKFHDVEPEKLAKFMKPDLDALVKEFKEFEIIQMDAADFKSGSHWKGAGEEKIQKIVQAASERKVMIFIDEIHQLDQSILDAMKSGLTSGNLRIIGATTIREFGESLAKDGAIVRRMPEFRIPVPTKEETLEIVKGVARKLERDFLVKVKDGAVEAAVEFSQKYVPGLKWPNSALEALKLAMGSKSLVATTGTSAFTKAKAEFAGLVAKHSQLQKQFKAGGGQAIKEEMDATMAAIGKMKDDLLAQQSLFEAQKSISELIRATQKKVVDSVNAISALKSQRDAKVQELDKIAKQLEELKQTSMPDGEKKILVDELEGSLKAEAAKFEDMGVEIANHQKNIDLLEQEVEQLLKQRASEFPEAANYSAVTATDIVEELLVKAGMDPKLVSREMGDALEEITQRLQASAKLSPEASRAAADVQLMAMSGFKSNLDSPNIYLAVGGDAGVERFGQQLTKGLWGESREAIVVDMKKFGDRPQDVFGVEKANYGDMKAGFVSQLVNSTMLQTIVFKNIDSVQNPEIIKYLEDILLKGKIEVQFGNETRLVDFSQTNIVISSNALADTSGETFEAIAKQSGQAQTMSAIKAIEEAIGESYRGSSDIIDMLRKNVQATIPVSGIKSDDAIEIIGGYLKDLSKKFMQNQSVKFIFDDSVAKQIFAAADELKVNPKDLQLQDIMNVVNNGDFMTAIARARLEQGIVAGDKVVVSFKDGVYIVKKVD